MKIIIFALCTLMVLHQCTANDDVESKWNRFKLEFRKTYSKVENTIRKAIFAKTLEKIAEHEEKFKKGEVSFEMGLNQFADMNDDEFSDEFARGVPFDPVFGRAEKARNVSSRSIPAYVNWVNYGYNNPVLQQGGCGSCYTFAAVAALEGQYFIKYKRLLKLSHQELLDCSKANGNLGCRGGWQRNVYQYMLSNNGLGMSDDNPYQWQEGTCWRSNPRVTIKNYYEIPFGNEEALKQAVANVGPVPIDMDASLDTFKNYRTGVYYDNRCRTDRLTHAITVVGYGTTEQGEDYWLVRNSWGPYWGENGYVRMSRNRNNHCGVASRAVYPIIS